MHLQWFLLWPRNIYHSHFTLNVKTLFEHNFFLGNYILTYLYSGSKQVAFVEEALAMLYARITKIAWFDSFKEEWPFRNVIADISKFLQVSVIPKLNLLKCK